MSLVALAAMAVTAVIGIAGITYAVSPTGYTRLDRR